MRPWMISNPPARDHQRRQQQRGGAGTDGRPGELRTKQLVLLHDRAEIALPLAEEIELSPDAFSVSIVLRLQRSTLSFALFNRELAVGVVTLGREPPVEQQIESEYNRHQRGQPE